MLSIIRIYLNNLNIILDTCKVALGGSIGWIGCIVWWLCSVWWCIICIRCVCWIGSICSACCIGSIAFIVRTIVSKIILACSTHAGYQITVATIWNTAGIILATFTCNCIEGLT